MADFDPTQRAMDDAARAQARSNRAAAQQDRAFARLSPERQAEARSNEAEAKMLKAIDAAVDARIKRLVIQSGNGINVTGGNGNFTVSLDVSALSIIGSSVVDCDADPPTVTFTISLK